MRQQRRLRRQARQWLHQQHHQASSAPVDLRLGYFPNVTHAPALVGIEGGIFEKSLGKNVTLKT